MNRHRFDRRTRSLFSKPSRRHLLGGLAGGVFGLRTGWFPPTVSAKQKRKKRRNKKRKKVTFNAFGCVSAGSFCKNSDQCCSGICEGKKGKKTCRAHGVGTCPQDVPGICTSESPGALTCNNTIYCYCYATTAGSNFCFDGAAPDLGFCAPCTTDAECEALGWPAGSACAPVFAGACSGACAGGMACLAPCGFDSPASG